MASHDLDGGELRSFLARIQAGDEDAARELLCHYEAEVRLVVRRQLPRLLRSRFDSIDFLQSVWGSFFQQVREGNAQFEDSQHLVGFLASVARNKVVDEYRQAGSAKRDLKREVPLWNDADQPREVATAAATPSQVLEALDVFERLRQMLPESRREILDLKAGGLTTREIGERLDLSERTVQRVLEELRQRVEQSRLCAG